MINNLLVLAISLIAAWRLTLILERWGEKPEQDPYELVERKK